jgi:hypothetical protein
MENTTRKYEDDIRIIDYNFLNEEEIIDIKNKVFNLKSLWFLSDNEMFHKPSKLYMLPIGLYTVPFFLNIEKYRNSTIEHKQIMLHNFEMYYNKIIKVVEEMFNKPVIYSDNLSVPGFHIFTYNVPNRKFFLNMHRDTYCHDDDVLKGKVYSLILPICLPKSGSGLIYKINNEQKYLKYNVGGLGVWDGNVEHSIDDFVLTDENDYRITLQFHISVNEKNIILFW